MTIDRPETAVDCFAGRCKGSAVGDLERILDKVPDRPPEPGDELKAGRPIASIAGNRRGCREIRARDLARHLGRNLGPGPLAGLGSATSRATVPATGASVSVAIRLALVQPLHYIKAWSPGYAVTSDKLPPMAPG